MTLRLTHDGLVYRPFASREHHLAVELQRRVWDPELATPAHQLIAAQSCGGVLLGAFTEDGTPFLGCVGFAYGFVAHGPEGSWIHSHQTGVAPDHRDRRIGETLKWLQRAAVLEAGHARVTWTFDPLRARNAHVNLEKLGATCPRYEADYYGELPGETHPRVPSDRLWVEWDLTSSRVRDRLDDFLERTGADPRPLRAEPGLREDPWPGTDEAVASAPDVLDTEAAGAGVRRPTDVVRLDLDESVVRVEIPADLDAVRAQLGGEVTLAWRMRVREALTAYLDRGYTVTGLRTSFQVAERRGWYVLERRDT